MFISENYDLRLTRQRNYEGNWTMYKQCLVHSNKQRKEKFVLPYSLYRLIDAEKNNKSNFYRKEYKKIFPKLLFFLFLFLNTIQYTSGNRFTDIVIKKHNEW